MKIFIIDNNRKLKKIKMILETNYLVETKNDGQFKMTKNDYVIVSDEVGTLEGLDKLKNIIFLATQRSEKYIWHFATQYKTIDIIDSAMNEEYIAQRIEKTIGRKV